MFCWLCFPEFSANFICRLLCGWCSDVNGKSKFVVNASSCLRVPSHSNQWLQVLSDTERSVCRMSHLQVRASKNWTSVLSSVKLQIHPYYHFLADLIFLFVFVLRPFDCQICMILVTLLLNYGTCPMQVPIVIFSISQVATAAFLSSTDICGSHSLMIPIVLAYPYVCRFFQCLRQYSDTKDKSALFNGMNYQI